MLTFYLRTTCANHKNQLILWTSTRLGMLFSHSYTWYNKTGRPSDTTKRFQLLLCLFFSDIFDQQIVPGGGTILACYLINYFRLQTTFDFRKYVFRRNTITLYSIRTYCANQWIRCRTGKSRIFFINLSYLSCDKRNKKSPEFRVHCNHEFLPTWTPPRVTCNTRGKRVSDRKSPNQRI